MANQYAIPTPVQFDRLYAGPLDKHEVFDSYADALTYAQGPISYAGQVIGVKKSELKDDVYVINEDKSISRLMIQREDVRLVLKASDWTGEFPFTQTLAVPYLESSDNCIISLGDSVNDANIVREIVNAKIGDTIQSEGSITFVAKGDRPTIDIPILVTIGSVVSAVEIPNNINDNTNHTVVIASKDGWKGSKPPYTQDLYVFGVRPDSMGTIGINPDSSYYNINRAAAATAGVIRYGQKNNYVTIAAMNSKPTRDLEVLVVWGDNIVVFENSNVLEDFNTTVDLVLKASEWTENKPYRQMLRVEGLSEFHTGAIGLSDNCTVEQAEIGLNAGLELKEQGNGYVVIEATDTKPTIDIPVYLIYGANITVVPSPEYVGEANKHVDAMAYSSKWTPIPNGWEQEVEVEGITSNSIGTMGLRNGVTELQSYAAAVARIKISKVYDNKVVLTATRQRPEINIPLSFVFGRNINVVKYPGVTGKVALDANYIVFDDSLIQSGLNSLQQVLDYFDRTKVNYSDIVDNTVSTDILKPLSANQGKVLNDKIDTAQNIINSKINEIESELIADINDKVNILESEIAKDIKSVSDDLAATNQELDNLKADLGNIIIKVQSTQPSAVAGKNVIWIKI